VNSARLRGASSLRRARSPKYARPAGLPPWHPIFHHVRRIACRCLKNAWAKNPVHNLSVFEDSDREVPHAAARDSPDGNYCPESKIASRPDDRIKRDRAFRRARGDSGNRVLHRSWSDGSRAGRCGHSARIEALSSEMTAGSGHRATDTADPRRKLCSFRIARRSAPGAASAWRNTAAPGSPTRTSTKLATLGTNSRPISEQFRVEIIPPSVRELPVRRIVRFIFEPGERTRQLTHEGRNLFPREFSEMGPNLFRAWPISCSSVSVTGTRYSRRCCAGLIVRGCRS